MQPLPTISPGVLTVRAFTGFEPFVFYREGELVGFDIDLVRDFAESVGLGLVVLPEATFDGVWLAPGRGEADVAAAGIARFVERLDSRVAWSEPYYSVLRSLLVHTDRATELTGMDAFAGRAIAFVAGSTADLDTRARAPATARLVPVDSQATGMRLLRSGKVDALAMGAPTNRRNQDAHPRFEIIDRHAFSQDEGLRFALSACNPALVAAMNAFIAASRAGGALAEHVARWQLDRAM